MKKYFIDPRLEWHKANMHTHTNLSDGYFSPEEMKKVYMEHGYSIVCFTDHEVIFDNSYLTDDKFVAITGKEHSITQYVDKDGNPLKWRDMKTVHLNFFAKDPHNLQHVCMDYDHASERQRKQFKERHGFDIPVDHYHGEFSQETLQNIINKANSAGFLVQFNHPNWSLNTREDYINLKGLWGFEIYNYLTDLETGAEYCPNIYDDMLRHGHRLFCTMGDDNHNYQGSLEGSFGGFTYIGVPKLTYENVIKALENGCFYCSMGPVIKSMYYDSKDKKIHIECSKAEDIVLVGYNRHFLHVYGENLTNAEFDINGEEVYVRISVKDKNNRWANTNPIYIEEIKEGSYE